MRPASQKWTYFNIPFSLTHPAFCPKLSYIKLCLINPKTRNLQLPFINTKGGKRHEKEQKKASFFHLFEDSVASGNASMCRQCRCSTNNQLPGLPDRPPGHPHRCDSINHLFYLFSGLRGNCPLDCDTERDNP